MEELPDRLRIPDKKGSKNTHLVVMALVGVYVANMSKLSASHDVLGMVQMMCGLRV